MTGVADASVGIAVGSAVASVTPLLYSCKCSGRTSTVEVRYLRSQFVKCDLVDSWTYLAGWWVQERRRPGWRRHCHRCRNSFPCRGPTPYAKSSLRALWKHDDSEVARPCAGPDDPDPWRVHKRPARVSNHDQRHRSCSGKGGSFLS